MIKRLARYILRKELSLLENEILTLKPWRDNLRHVHLVGLPPIAAIDNNHAEQIIESFKKFSKNPELACYYKWYGLFRNTGEMPR